MLQYKNDEEQIWIDEKESWVEFGDFYVSGDKADKIIAELNQSIEKYDNLTMVEICNDWYFHNC